MAKGPGPQQIFNSTIVKINFTSLFLVVCYDFRSNVPLPAFSFTGLPFDGDFDVLDKKIRAVHANKPPAKPFEAPKLVYPISDEMMERLDMFTAKPPDFNTFNTSFEGLFFPNNSQVGNIYFNLVNIKKLLGKDAKSLTIKAIKPNVSGFYSGSPHEGQFVANVFAGSRSEAEAVARFGWESIPDWNGTYVSTDFITQQNPPFEDQWATGITYITTPQVKKFASWRATAWTYKKNKRKFDQGPAFAEGRTGVEPAPEPIDKKMKSDGFGASKDQFMFTVDLKTLKVT